MRAVLLRVREKHGVSRRWGSAIGRVAERSFRTLDARAREIRGTGSGSGWSGEMTFLPR